MNRPLTLAAVLAAMLVTACDDTTSEIGYSLTDENDQLDIVAATATATSRTVKLGSVLSLTNTCYLGRVADPLTHSLVETSFTTQFHPLEQLQLYPQDSVLSRIDGRVVADTCDLVLYLSSPFYGADSLSAIKLRVREMAVPAEEGQHYYTDFDPEDRNMLRTDAGAMDVEKVFSYEDQTVSAARRDSTGYLDNIHVNLNRPYTDTEGNTYNNYGTYLMRKYYENPALIHNIWNFTHKVCPGMLLEIVDGTGFYAKVTDVGLRLSYTVKNDSTFRSTVTLAGTHEVLQTTRVENDEAVLDSLQADQSCTYIKSPAALATELTLPVEQIKRGHDRDSLIAASITLQRLNNESMEQRQMSIPQTLLMVQSDSVQSFFERTKLPDNRTSFLTAFTAATNVYTFNNISNMITWLWTQRQNGEKTDPQWTEHHPNWNRVVLLPVNTIYSSSSTSSTLTGVEHSMSLAATRLANTKDDGQLGIEVSVVYAKFNE
ncbi:MAG: DUF4270 domain-containing protein [Prevotella sp.]|nr:DUF4270 domain-containing protein [Prevotella sp.]